jgi:hypothetical protein
VPRDRNVSSDALGDFFAFFCGKLFEDVAEPNQERATPAQVDGFGPLSSSQSSYGVAIGRLLS